MKLRPSLSLEKTLKFEDIVPGQSPQAVFNHGREAGLLPNIRCLEIAVDNSRFDVGAGVHARIAIAKLRLNVGFEGAVTDCSLEEGIRIAGEAPPFGGASMWLKMSSIEEGTHIDYGINLRAQDVTRLGALSFMSLALNRGVEGFASQYKENVLGAIALSHGLEASA